MADVNSVIQRLEGYVSNIANMGPTASPATNENQGVAVWLENMKAIMRQPFLRDQTDWELFTKKSIVAAGTAVIAAAGHFYGALYGNINTSYTPAIAVFNLTSKTYDPTAAMDAGQIAADVMPAAASASYREYLGVTKPTGVICGTGITVAAKGAAGNALTTNDLSAVIVYRTT